MSFKRVAHNSYKVCRYTVQALMSRPWTQKPRLSTARGRSELDKMIVYLWDFFLTYVCMSGLEEDLWLFVSTSSFSMVRANHLFCLEARGGDHLPLTRPFLNDIPPRSMFLRGRGCWAVVARSISVFDHRTDKICSCGPQILLFWIQKGICCDEMGICPTQHPSDCWHSKSS